MTDVPPLTTAEKRVLAAMISAASEADAARQLNVSPHTIHAHLRNIRSKFGVRTTRQALARLLI
jgi:DNA-binding CsgD family transcriptional regulator